LFSLIITLAIQEVDTGPGHAYILMGRAGSKL